MIVHETVEFLLSLEHHNQLRPRFAIGQGANPMLSISFRGANMDVPMAEVLEFARRWNKSNASLHSNMLAGETLLRHPYPLFNVRVDDPDVTGLTWE